MSRSRTRVLLVDLPPRTRAEVVAVEPSVMEDLGREGINPGTAVSILARAPFGGAIVLGLGRARIAVPHRVAKLVRVRPLTARLDS